MSIISNIITNNDQKAYEFSIYTRKNAYKVNEPINFTLLARPVTGLELTPQPLSQYQLTSLHINFNDTITQTICSYNNIDTFEYTFKTAKSPAVIQITALGGISAAYFTLSTLNIYTDLPRLQPASRQNIAITPELPFDEIQIPINDFQTKEVFNTTIVQMNSNIEYIKNLCRFYKSSPTRFVGWGNSNFANETLFCSETTTSEASSTALFGILEGFNKAIPLLKTKGLSSFFGTSKLTVVSSVFISPDDIIEIPDTFYKTNLNNIVVQLLSCAQLQTLQTNEISSLRFTHTVYDLQDKQFTFDQNADSTIRILTGEYIVIDSCDEYKIVPLYEIQGIEVVQDYQYDPHQLNWHFTNQFDYDPSYPGNDGSSDINDILIYENNLLLSKNYNIEMYDLDVPYTENIFSSNTIDILDSLAQYKSVAISSDLTSIYTLDINRSQIKGFTKSLISQKYEQTIEWGELGGPTNNFGLYKPTQIIARNKFVYILDAGNKCIKQYTELGSWVITFYLPSNVPGLPVSMCFDLADRIHVVYQNNILIISLDGRLLQNTQVTFESAPTKIITNSNKDVLYICCKRQVYRLTVNHTTIDFFATIDNQINPKLDDYISIACNESNEFFITDGKNIVRYIDNAETISSRTTLADNKMWSLQELQINSDEFVTDWVYNRCFRRVGENLEILYRSIHSKIVINDINKVFELSPINDKDVGYFNGLPISIDDLSYIGMNEVVTAEAINRVLNKLQTNIHFLFNVIQNKITLNKMGYIENYKLEPVIIEKCCWDWKSRSTGMCCTPWYWLNDSTTWIEARNPNDAVRLESAQFAIQDNYVLNKTNINFAISFWLSGNIVENTTPYNILGLDIDEQSSRGYSIQIDGNELKLAINIEGTQYKNNVSINSPDLNTLNHFCIFVISPNTSLINEVSAVCYTNGSINEQICAIAQTSFETLPTESSDIDFYDFIFGSTNVDFRGILHDIRLLEIPYETHGNSLVNLRNIADNLFDKPRTENVATYIKDITISHWYANDSTIWMDSANENHTTRVSLGSAIEVIGLFGSCCE